MSMEQVSKVDLGPHQVFDHTAVLRAEIDLFKDNFERNERYREFDGLIRRNHRIYEAMDLNLLPQLQSQALTNHVEKIEKLTARIEKLTTPQFHKNRITNIDWADLTATDIAKIAEASLRKPAEPARHMSTIVEVDSNSKFVDIAMDSS
uniref:Biogenesis of lysosome-related organelles complex 1 subunit 5 n=1 Tax=Panagrellus redivivus TaxID=6233 RepID=A0A7E4V9N9_PANRE